jgi:hypothetical protein
MMQSDPNRSLGWKFPDTREIEGIEATFGSESGLGLSENLLKSDTCGSNSLRRATGIFGERIREQKKQHQRTRRRGSAKSQIEGEVSVTA